MPARSRRRRRWTRVSSSRLPSSPHRRDLGEPRDRRAHPRPRRGSVHALCPFGGVVSIYQYVTSGTYVKKIHDASFILMYLGFALALLFGPVFCGWVCPFGSVQEWIGKLGRKLLRKRYNTLVPRKLDRIMRHFRYVVLAGVVYMTARSAQLVFENVDPYYALFAFWTGEVALPALIVLGVVLLASLVVERPFCKFACPYGAVQGVFNLFRVFTIRRNAGTCIDCSKCDRACPMNIEVSSKAVIRDHQCISCMKCTSELSCPVADTVALTRESWDRGIDMKLKPWMVAVATAVVIFGGIALTAAFNLWRTSRPRSRRSTYRVSLPARATPATFAAPIPSATSKRPLPCLRPTSPGRSS